MPRVTVIDSNDRRILLWDGTAVRAIPYDPYHSLKYKHFDGNRIFHAFGGDRRLRIEETYNDGVFNAYMTPLDGDDNGAGGSGVDGAEGGAGNGASSAAADDSAAAPVEMVVQIPDAIGIAEAVLADDADAYDRLFRHWHGKHMQSEIVDYLMVAGNSNRVRAVATSRRRKETGEPEGAYVVDDRFIVDERGSSYYYRGDGGRLPDAPQLADDDSSDGDAGDGGDDELAVVDMDEWKYLCLVAESGKRGRDGSDGDDGGPAVKVPGKGAWKMTAVTRMVIAKIAFLLHPADDDVFLNQLPEAMRASVKRMIKDGDAY